MLNSVVGMATSAAGMSVNSDMPFNKNSSLSGVAPSLTGVVTDLANSLMSGGKPDLNSPLGKMVQAKLSENKGLGQLELAANPEKALKNALMDIVKDKMGSNFIADAGHRDSKDLMNQVMSGLGKSALNDALRPKGDGTTFAKEDKPLLQQVADYMDKNKATFGAPDAGSWSKELDEDNYLSRGETAKFKQALEQVSQQMGAGGSRTDYAGDEGLRGGATGFPGTQGGLGSDPSLTGGQGLNELDQLRQMLNNKDGMNVFQQGLQMGLDIASGALSGAQGQHTAAHAAQNVLDVMRASLT